MTQWLLILTMLSPTANGAAIGMEKLATKAECHAVGKNWQDMIDAMSRPRSSSVYSCSKINVLPGA